MYFIAYKKKVSLWRSSSEITLLHSFFGVQSRESVIWAVSQPVPRLNLHWEKKVTKRSELENFPLFLAAGETLIYFFLLNFFSCKLRKNWLLGFFMHATNWRWKMMKLKLTRTQNKEQQNLFFWASNLREKNFILGIGIWDFDGALSYLCWNPVITNPDKPNSLL